MRQELILFYEIKYYLCQQKEIYQYYSRLKILNF